MRKILMRVLSVIVSLIGLALICSVIIVGKMFVIVTGTIVLIIGVALWQTSDQKGYNNAVGIAKLVEGSGLSLWDVYESVKSMETPFGRAWLGKVKLLRPMCIIFGPGSDGSFVYVCQKRRGILISQCTSAFWLNATPEELRAAQENSGAAFGENTFWRFSRDADGLVNELYERVSALAGKPA